MNFIARKLPALSLAFKVNEVAGDRPNMSDEGNFTEANGANEGGPVSIMIYD
jgi:hypothetical protein